MAKIPVGPIPEGPAYVVGEYTGDLSGSKEYTLKFPLGFMPRMVLLWKLYSGYQNSGDHWTATSFAAATPGMPFETRSNSTIIETIACTNDGFSIHAPSSGYEKNWNKAGCTYLHIAFR